MVDIAAGILTNGLGGNASNMILGQWHLGFFGAVIIITPPSGGSGGSEVSGPPPARTDDWEANQKYSVFITLTFKNKKIERMYMVGKKRADVTIKISKVLNAFTKKVSVIIREVRHKTYNTFVRFIDNSDK